MPTGTCDPASRGEAWNQVVETVPAPDGSGSVTYDCLFGWDGVSVRPNCDGPTHSAHAVNNSDMVAWASLPNKKKPPLYVPINPGDDVTVTSPGQLNNLGLSNYSDFAAVQIVFTQPT